MRDSVLYLRFPENYLFSRDSNHFAIAPDGNRNPIAPMFGDRFCHSPAKGFFGFGNKSKKGDVGSKTT
jgi:hypothetical protein